MSTDPKNEKRLRKVTTRSLRTMKEQREPISALTAYDFLTAQLLDQAGIDVILVGEVRDRETAEIAMQAALTGHFVFTTLHANDTATTVARLLDIGIDATLIQSAVTAVLAQRLVRVLCAKCKLPYEPPPEFLARCGLDPTVETTFYRENEKGCPACLGTGFRGRTGVYELLPFDNTIKDLLVGRPSIQAIRAAAKKAGMRTLQDSAMQKVISGMTSVTEVARVTKQ